MTRSPQNPPEGSPHSPSPTLCAMRYNGGRKGSTNGNCIPTGQQTATQSRQQSQREKKKRKLRAHNHFMILI